MSNSSKFSQTVIQYVNRFHLQDKDDMAIDHRDKDDAKKAYIIETMENIFQTTKIKVSDLKDNDLKIDQDNLLLEMENTMILHSYVINDIFELKKVLETLKSHSNALIQLLHHKLRFQNQYKLKTIKEIETYISGDRYYNRANELLKQIEAQIEKSSQISFDLKQKISFIRDVQKHKTQELYRDQNG